MCCKQESQCSNGFMIKHAAQADAAACLRGRYSIDHCLYVAVAYCGSYSAARAERARDAMTAMGISLNAGCFGKLNVGIPLFSCVMPIFRWGPIPCVRARKCQQAALFLLLHTASIKQGSHSPCCLIGPSPPPMSPDLTPHCVTFQNEPLCGAELHAPAGRWPLLHAWWAWPAALWRV